MSQADLFETKHSYAQAIQSFGEAVRLSETRKLPAKYLTTALCRRTSSEVRLNLIPQADADCDRLMRLLTDQKANHTLDPDTEVWILDLANTYQAHEDPNTREDCLLKLCLINKTLYGENNREYRNARTLLGKFYEQGQTVKAARIQSDNEEAAIRHSEMASDPATRASILSRLALHDKIAGKLDEAKKVELQLLEIAKTTAGVADGIPAYYAYLGCISLVQNREAESRDYIVKSIKACSKVRGYKPREDAVYGLLNGLIDSIKFDKNPHVTNLASKELKELLSVEQAVSNIPERQYGTLRMLADTLSAEGKPDEACEYLKKAIALASRPKSPVASDLSDLWMRIALIRNGQGKATDANAAFTRALVVEQEKTGFHATKVLVFWGGLAYQREDLALASEKLSVAVKQAEAIPLEKRGTLLIDPLYGLCMIKIRAKDLKANQELMSKLIPEINQQIALNNNLGPNFWNKLHRDRFIW